MNTRTVREFTVDCDIWAAVEAWAGEHGYSLLEASESRRLYQRGSVILAMPAMLEVDRSGDRVQLQAWLRRDRASQLLTMLGTLFIVRPSLEMALEPGGWMAPKLRNRARAEVNELLGRLGQPPIADKVATGEWSRPESAATREAEPLTLRTVVSQSTCSEPSGAQIGDDVSVESPAGPGGDDTELDSRLLQEAAAVSPRTPVSLALTAGVVVALLAALAVTAFPRETHIAPGTVQTFVIVLFLLSCPVLLAGLLRPGLVLRWGGLRTRRRVLEVYGTATVVLLVLVGVTSPPSRPTVPASINTLANVFFSTFLLACFGLVAGLISPGLAIRWGERKTRLQAALVYIPVIAAALALFVVVNPNRHTTTAGKAAPTPQPGMQLATAVAVV